MKALNYFAAIMFGFLAITTAIIALVKKDYYLFSLTVICGVLSFVAWSDYKKCIKEEKF